MHSAIVDKILTIVSEDKNQPEQILKYDLSRMLESEISSIKEFSYELGYEDCKEKFKNGYYNY